MFSFKTGYFKYKDNLIGYLANKILKFEFDKIIFEFQLKTGSRRVLVITRYSPPLKKIQRSGDMLVITLKFNIDITIFVIFMLIIQKNSIIAVE